MGLCVCVCQCGVVGNGGKPTNERGGGLKCAARNKAVCADDQRHEEDQRPLHVTPSFAQLVAPPTLFRAPSMPGLYIVGKTICFEKQYLVLLLS